MIIDTDVFIFLQRGNEKAATFFKKIDERFISIYSYMELLQGAQNKGHHRVILDFLKKFNVVVLPLTENIGHRAAIYVEEYSMANGVRAGDALVAATAVENTMPLATANNKHFKIIKELT